VEKIVGQSEVNVTAAARNCFCFDK